MCTLFTSAVPQAAIICCSLAAASSSSTHVLFKGYTIPFDASYVLCVRLDNFSLKIRFESYRKRAVYQA